MLQSIFDATKVKNRGYNKYNGKYTYSLKLYRYLFIHKGREQIDIDLGQLLIMISGTRIKELQDSAAESWLHSIQSIILCTSDSDQGNEI